MEFDLRELPSRQSLTELAERIPELDVPSVETFLIFLRTAADVFKKVSINLSRFGITPGRMMILMSLFKTRHGLAPSELAESLGVTRGTITGLLDGLEREELIQRCENPADRRMITIQLTDKGSKLLTDMLPSHFLLISEIMKRLNEDDFKTFVQLLDKIRTRVSEI